MKVGISGCFGFFKCRYDGGGFMDFDLENATEFFKKEFDANTIDFYPVCPEQLGGLTTPRIPAEIIGGDGKDVWANKAKVMSKEGKDVTNMFKKGAQEVLHFAKKQQINVFLLKENSPSCGLQTIYSGNFDNTKKPGAGTTTSLLIQNGIKVFSESQIKEYLRKN